MNARDLAIMAATLANGGVNPVTHQRMIDAKHIPGVLAVMATAGLYDDSGKWLFATGLPGQERRRRRIDRGVARQVRHRRDLAAARLGRQQRARPEGIADISAALGGNPYGVRRITGTAAGEVARPPRR